MDKEKTLEELRNDLEEWNKELQSEMEKEEKNLGRIDELEELIKESAEKLTEKEDLNNDPIVKTKIIEVSIPDNKVPPEITEENKNLPGTDWDRKSSVPLETGSNQKEEEQEKDPEEKEEEKRKQKEAEAGEQTMTLREWQRKSGVEIVPDEAVRRKYDMYLTQDEFMTILNNENVPKVIKEVGKAEQFLKSPEDWDCVRTSPDALAQTLNKNDGKLPIEGLNENSYMLMVPNDKIGDRDSDGDIDIDDLKKPRNSEISYEEQQLKEKIPPEILNKYELLKVEEACERAKASREATKAVVNIAIGNNLGATASAMAGVAKNMEADFIATECGKIEDEYDVTKEEEYERKPPVS